MPTTTVPPVAEDFPARSAVLVPLGLALSFAALHVRSAVLGDAGVAVLTLVVPAGRRAGTCCRARCRARRRARSPRSRPAGTATRP